MAERARRRWAGWYPDPRDPTTVRHWDGRSWHRERDRPAWSLATGELVVDTEGHAGRRGPGGPPVIEGPVRPAPERATTAALNVSGEPRRPATHPARLRPRSPAVGPQAGHFAAAGVAGGLGGGPAWAASRRPMAILGLMVVSVVVALTAIVGLTGPHQVDPGPLPSSFVSEASKECTQTLGTRPSAIPTDPLAITAQDDQLDGLGSDLRTLAIADHGNFQADGWLTDWQDFTTTERARVVALGRAGQPGAAELAAKATSDAAAADRFAAGSELSSCSILAAAPAALQHIPT